MINANLKTDYGNLRKLKVNLQKNVLKKAVRAGAKLIVQDLRSTAPKKRGALRKSIAAKVDLIKGTATVYGVVGPRSKFIMMLAGRKHQPSRYAHFLEVGKFKRPFLLPTWNSKKSIYINTVSHVISVEVNKILSK